MGLFDWEERKKALDQHRGATCPECDAPLAYTGSLPDGVLCIGQLDRLNCKGCHLTYWYFWPGPGSPIIYSSPSSDLRDWIWAAGRRLDDWEF